MLRTTPHRSRLSRAATSLIALSLIAAACGDDDEPAADEPAAEEPAAEEPAAEEPAAEEPAAEEPAAEEPAAEEPAAEEPPAEEPASDDLEAVRADVERFLAGDVELPAPTEPLDPGDRTVAIIAAGMASTGPATVATAMQDAVEVIGWETAAPFDGQFVPTEQATGISQAVADGVDAILLVAITPSAVSAAVAEAQAAGIPIVCVLCGPDPITDGIYNVQADADAAGYAQAAYATAMSDGTGTIVLYQNDEFRFSAEQGAATERYLAEICPGCTVDVRSVLLLEAREPNAPIHTSLLEEYGEGELDFVIHPFDSPSGALATTASQLGRTDFGVIGYGALSPFVDMIGVGDPAVAEASVTISSPYYGWAAVDIAARVLNGAELWEAGDMPVAMITMENFGSYPEGKPYLYPDFEFAEYFGQLWGS